MIDNILKFIPLGGFIVSLLSISVGIYAVFGPISEIQKNVALQNYRRNIEIQFNYPDLKPINSWNDSTINNFVHNPLYTNQKGESVYQAQFCVINAPNDFTIETFIFKRFVTDGNPNIFQQYIVPIELRLPDKDNRAFAKDENRPRIFKLDMVIVDQNPTTIIVNVLDRDRSVIKTGFYHIE